MKSLDIATKRLLFTRFLKSAALFSFFAILGVHVIDVVGVFVQVDGLNHAANKVDMGHLSFFSSGLGAARLGSIDSIRSLSLVLVFTCSVVAAFMVRLGPADK